MDKVFELLVRFKFHVMVFVGGFAVVLAAFVEGVTKTSTGGAVQLQATADSRLIALGVFLIVLSIVVFVLQPGDSDGSGEANRGTAWPLSIGYANRVAELWGGLSPTQRALMRFLYKRLHKSEIPLDNLFETLTSQYAKEAPATADELFYRLRDLERKGLLRLVPTGEHATVVASIPKVGKVLLEKKKLIT